MTYHQRLTIGEDEVGNLPETCEEKEETVHDPQDPNAHRERHVRVFSHWSAKVVKAQKVSRIH